MTKKFKPGTIGYKADRLFKRYGHYTNGIVILAFALEKAIGQPVNYFTPKFSALMEKEQETINRILGEISKRNS